MNLMRLVQLVITFSICLIQACLPAAETASEQSAKIRLITLDPGHFHAALVQKSMYPEVDSVVHVYAPKGSDVENHLKLVDKYNTREVDPTHWNQKVYTGSDYLETMFREKPGNVVVIAGNNLKKTGYIKQSLDSGFNVLADKPLAIDEADFQLLEQAFATAKEKKLLLYDIMTERFETNTILQKEISGLQEIFGTLEKGSRENPAVVKESVHHFYKMVSGQPLIRPAWFFDVEQQGNGIVDVTTHFADLIQWVCFPGVAIDYKKDVTVLDAERTATTLDLKQFRQVTNLDSFPAYLQKDIKDGKLNVYSNGKINYRLKDVHAAISVIWNYEAPEGTGDTHYSIMRGSRANLVIRQGKEQKYQPTLYIEPVKANDAEYEHSLRENFTKIQEKFPGTDIKKNGIAWEVTVPAQYHVGHEAHFAQVMKKYIEYLVNGNLPEWEVPNMLAKYYTTITALKMAKSK